MKKFFAEWEKQEAILLVFPHKNTDWKPYLEEVRETFCQILYAIIQVQSCLLICDNKKQVKDFIQNFFTQNHYDLKLTKRLYCIELPTNDTWARDFGGISILNQNKIQILDYGFNGWGLKFPANYDNQITQKLKIKGILKNVKTKKLILEGGSIESNGEGILLTNTQCLLEANRNPSYSQAKIEKILKKDLGLKQILWLNYGYLSGDDTNSHIDTLVRFIDKKTLVYVRCENPKDEHYEALCKMEEELQNLRDLDNKPFKLIPLPFCEPIYYKDKRLPATYANFLFINGAILFPIYGDKNDKKAMNTLQKACPKHKVIPIDCSILIRQGGSLHCISMQFPKGSLKLKKTQSFYFS